MILVEQHNISKHHQSWKQIDALCFLSKNLYNQALYEIKQHYLLTGKTLRYHAIEKILKNKEEQFNDYRKLNSQVSQQILLLLDHNIKSFFALIKKYKKDKTSLNGCPKFPKYKDKLKGRNILIFSGFNTKILKNGFVHFPKKTNLQPIKTNITTKIKEVRIIPKSGNYTIEVVYEVPEKELITNNNYSAIDLGINNLATLTFNNNNAIIINGKPLKSINQYYNKHKAKIQCSLEKNHKKKTSKKLTNFTTKRNNKIKDYLHKSSRIIVNYLAKNNVSSLVVGYNPEWKQEVNLGKRNNQQFVSIPHLTFIKMIEYKCKLEGINCKVITENYTSKCSALDNEKICKHENYLGNRIKRGLFKTSKNLLINADINGSLNIGRKEFGDAYVPTDIGLVLNPIKINSL